MGRYSDQTFVRTIFITVETNTTCYGVISTLEEFASWIDNKKKCQRQIKGLHEPKKGKEKRPGNKTKSRNNHKPRTTPHAPCAMSSTQAQRKSTLASKRARIPEGRGTI
jgi:hypothetical protein